MPLAALARAAGHPQVRLPEIPKGRPKTNADNDLSTRIVTAAQAWLAQHAVGLLVAVIVLALGWYLAAFLSRQAARLLPRTGHIDNTVAPLVSQLIRYGILLVTLIVVLSQFGVQTASILAVLGAAGLAIALALQGTLSNLAAGLMMIWLRPFGVGDSIETKDVSGTVLEVGLFGTRLVTYDGVFKFAPNSQLWSAIVTNYSRQPHRMVEIKFAIGPDAAYEVVRDILMEIARDPRVLPDPPPAVFVDAFTELGTSVGFRAWVLGADWWNVRCDFLAAIRQRLDQAGIDLAQRNNTIVLERAASADQARDTPDGARS